MQECWLIIRDSGRNLTFLKTGCLYLFNGAQIDARRGCIYLLASDLTVLCGIGLILRYLDYDYICHS